MSLSYRKTTSINDFEIKKVGFNVRAKQSLLIYIY